MIVAILVIGICLVTVAHAEDTNQRSDVVVSSTESLLEQTTAIKLTDAEKVLAKQWMLKESDWIKYRNIMSGPRGIWSPGLDPITALGVSEEDTEERKRYAKIWQEVESKRVILELAFDVERQEAGKRSNGDMLAIDNRKWISEWNNKQARITKQVLLFVDSECMDGCKEVFESVWNSISRNARLDIFFRIGATAEKIAKWASYMEIDPSTVSKRAITLNFDNEKSTRLNVDMTSVDQIPQVRVVDIATGDIWQTFE